MGRRRGRGLDDLVVDVVLVMVVGGIAVAWFLAGLVLP